MTNISKAYGAFFSGWLKGYGPKPTESELVTAGHFGRVGKQTLALAMALRDGGTTASQIIGACGAPQNNHRREVIDAGWFKRDMTVPAAENGHTVYKITLTKKGEGELAKREKVAAEKAATGDAPKAKKAKAKGAKARKAKATPATDTGAPAGAVNASEPQGEQAQA